MLSIIDIQILSALSSLQRIHFDGFKLLMKIVVLKLISDITENRNSLKKKSIYLVGHYVIFISQMIKDILPLSYISTYSRQVVDCIYVLPSCTFAQNLP